MFGNRSNEMYLYKKRTQEEKEKEVKASFEVSIICGGTIWQYLCNINKLLLWNIDHRWWSKRDFPLQGVQITKNKQSWPRYVSQGQIIPPKILSFSARLGLGHLLKQAIISIKNVFKWTLFIIAFYFESYLDSNFKNYPLLIC